MTVHLQKDIERLHQEMLTMSGRVEQMVQTAVGLLTDCDYETAVDFGRRDDEIDRLDVEIEDRALKALALPQPVAGDLRKITAGELHEYVFESATRLQRNQTPQLHGDPDQVLVAW